jgi:hypothetical protein
MISATARIMAVINDAVFPRLKLAWWPGNLQSNSFDPHGWVALECPFSSWAFAPFLDFLKSCGDFFRELSFHSCPNPFTISAREVKFCLTFICFSYEDLGRQPGS